MTKKNNTGIMLNELASIVAKGFESTSTKDDLKELRAELKGDIHLSAKKWIN